jgi:hypothetical protein
MIKFAHFDYKQKRISFHQEEKIGDDVSTSSKARKMRQVYGRVLRPSKVNRTIRVRRRIKCPRHGTMLAKMEEVAERVVMDLIFSKGGCKKRLIKYIGAKSYCKTCGCDYCPPAIAIGHTQAFGDGFRAWVTYQRIALRQPYQAIAQMIDDMFGEHLSTSTVVSFVQHLANGTFIPRRSCSGGSKRACSSS